MREAAGRRVAEHLLALPRVREAPRVALYAALGEELPTHPLFEALAELACERLLPRIAGAELEFVPVADWSELRPGRFGVPEPVGEPVAALGAGDVLVVPGLAFDDAGNRLGRGGGYYDRLLAAAAGGLLRVGACLELQRVQRVPHDSRDRPVDAIVTERGVRWAARRP